MNISIECALNVCALNARLLYKYLYCASTKLSAAANEIFISNNYVSVCMCVAVCVRTLVMSKERAYFKRYCVL